MGRDESCQPSRQEFILPSGYLLPVSANLPVIAVQPGLVAAGPVMAGPGWSCPEIPRAALTPRTGTVHDLKNTFSSPGPARGVSPSPEATPAQLPGIQTRSGAKTVPVGTRTSRRGTSAPDLEGNNAITSYHMRMTKGFPALGAAHGMGR